MDKGPQLLSTPNVTSVYLALTLSVMTLPVMALTSSSDWRTLARHARAAIDHQDYGEAINSYKAALKAIGHNAPRSQIAVDLQLGLADAYRKKRDFVEAEKLLHEIAPLVLNGESEDPLLPARYWRRKSSLLLDQGKKSEAVQALARSWSIVKQHFPVDSQYYTENFYRLAMLLSQAKEWMTLADLLDEIRTAAPNGSAPLEKVIDDGCSQCRIAALAMMRSGDLERSKDLLNRLNNVDNDFEHLFELWQHWNDCCYKRSENSRGRHAVVAVNRLLERTRGLPFPLSLHAQVQARACLANIYETIGEANAACSEWKALFQLIDSLGKYKSQNERTLWRTAQCRILALESEATFQSKTEPGLLQLVEYTKDRPDLTLTATTAMAHCMSRCQLALIYINKGKLQDAQMMLSGISPEAPRFCKTGYKRLCALHLRMAKALFYQNDVIAARKHYQLASVEFNLLPSEQKAELQSRLKLIQDLLKTKEG